MVQIVFNTENRDKWISVINSSLSDLIGTEPATDKKVLLVFRDINSTRLRPEHFVSLACFIEVLAKSGFSVSVDTSEVGKYLIETLKFREYWAGHQSHTRSYDNSVLNLWRINDSEKDFYAERVKDYLQPIYSEKDLSGISQCIVEACYNIFDHADTDNAFSFVKFDKEKSLLSVAVCDFGIGIARSIQSVYKDISDTDALKEAIKPLFTIHSREHNSGMGLSNITSNSEYRFMILSNNAVLLKKGDIIKSLPSTEPFNGTLLAFDIDINQYEEREEMDFTL